MFSLYDISVIRVALGTPENWNEGIRRATGQWIKLIHDDDWLASEHSLQKFADAINNHPGAAVLFCAYRNNWLQSGKQEDMLINDFRYKQLLKQPAVLFSSNVVGRPAWCCTLTINSSFTIIK